MDKVQYAREKYDQAATDVEYALGYLSARIGRELQQIADARADKPIALDEPEWISQDALKVTVALSKYATARRDYGNALAAEQIREGITA